MLIRSSNPSYPLAWLSSALKCLCRRLRLIRDVRIGLVMVSRQSILFHWWLDGHCLLPFYSCLRNVLFVRPQHQYIWFVWAGASGCGSGSGPPSDLSWIWTIVDLWLSVVGVGPTFGAIFCCGPLRWPCCYLCSHLGCCLLCWMALYIFIRHWPLMEWPLSSPDLTTFYAVLQCCIRVVLYVTF